MGLYDGPVFFRDWELAMRIANLRAKLTGKRRTVTRQWGEWMVT